MKSFWLAGFLSACTLAAQSNSGIASSIEGHVFNSVTSAPIRKATVVLTTAQITSRQIRLIAETDAAGNFQFTGLPPGTYRILASHSGFFDHPARRPISLGTNDRVTDTEIRLPPQGAIAGRILDEDGDPVGGAGVVMFKQVFRDGRKQWKRSTGPLQTRLANTAFQVSGPGATYCMPTTYGGRSITGSARAISPKWFTS